MVLYFLPSDVLALLDLTNWMVTIQPHQKRIPSSYLGLDQANVEPSVSEPEMMLFLVLHFVDVL